MAAQSSACVSGGVGMRSLREVSLFKASLRREELPVDG